MSTPNQNSTNQQPQPPPPFRFNKRAVSFFFKHIVGFFSIEQKKKNAVVNWFPMYPCKCTLIRENLTWAWWNISSHLWSPKGWWVSNRANGLGTPPESSQKQPQRALGSQAFFNGNSLKLQWISRKLTCPFQIRGPFQKDIYEALFSKEEVFRCLKTNAHVCNFWCNLW